MFGRTSQWLRNIIPGDSSEPEVAHRSIAENVYHGCMPKTASQWVARLLSSDETYQYSALRAYAYHRHLPDGVDKRKISDRSFDQPFPPRTVVTPIYLSLPNMLGIPKPNSWRGFFVMRDPRDIVVSWYFSWKHSHPAMGDVSQGRELLQTMSLEEGLGFGIDRFQERGMFSSLRSWADLSGREELITARYEDLVGPNQFDHMRRVFNHCDIRMPDPVLRSLLERNSFSALTKGRAQGTEDVRSHLRKGVQGDWKNHFTPAVEKKFREVTGSLVEELGYAW